MQRLADGYSVAAVARELEVRRNTVRDWRERPECRVLLERARAARADACREAAEEARRIYREAAARAAQRMVDLLDDPTHAPAAARDILDRIGVLRGEELRLGGAVDLSRLSDDELAALEAAAAKVAKAGP
jgi:transposase-like protein